MCTVLLSIYDKNCTFSSILWWLLCPWPHLPKLSLSQFFDEAQVLSRKLYHREVVGPQHVHPSGGGVDTVPTRSLQAHIRDTTQGGRKGGRDEPWWGSLPPVACVRRLCDVGDGVLLRHARAICWHKWHVIVSGYVRGTSEYSPTCMQRLFPFIFSVKSYCKIMYKL